MRSEKEMLDLIMDLARKDDRIRAIYMSGSRIDPNATHDKYSDFDIVYIVEDIQSFTNDESWIDYFGERLILQKPNDWYKEPYDYSSNNDFVYLMQFKDGNRIDLTLVDIKNVESRVKDTEPRKILLDKDGINGLNDIEVNCYYNTRKPSKQEFADCCNEFWWISINTAKGLCRKEFIFTKFMMERYQRDMFLKMVDWSIGINNDFSVATGKCYKYFGRYLSKSEMDRVRSTFPSGDYEDIWHKLFEMCKYFNELAAKVSQHFKFDYSKVEAENVSEYLNKMKREYIQGNNY